MLDDVTLGLLRSPRACRTDRRNDVPSRTNDSASTAYAIPKSVAGSAWKSSWMPCVTDTPAPTANSPIAANIDHTYASRP